MIQINSTVVLLSKPLIVKLTVRPARARQIETRSIYSTRGSHSFVFIDLSARDRHNRKYIFCYGILEKACDSVGENLIDSTVSGTVGFSWIDGHESARVQCFSRPLAAKPEDDTQSSQ